MNAAVHHSAVKVAAGEMNSGLRAQTTFSAGARPGVLKDPAPQGAVTVGYVAAPGPLLAAPLLASTEGEAVDNAALSFLLQQSLAAQQKEEEEELEAARRQLLSLLAVPLPLRTAEQLSRIQDCNGVIRRTRNLKKRKKKKLPRAPRPRCGRPCARQRQVPAVRPSDSVHRRFLDIPVVQQRQVPTVHTLLVQFLVKVDVPVVVQRQVRGSMLQKTVVCPQLQFAGLLHPCRGAEADLHGPDYSSDHRGPTSGKTSSGRSSITMRELILRLNSSTWRSSLQSSIIAWAVWHVVNYGVLGPDSQAIRGLYAVGQFSDKVVFLPGVGQRLALMVQTVLKPVQFSVMNVDMPAAGQRLALMVQTVPKPVEFPQVQFLDEVVFMPVVGQRLALMVQTVPKPVEFTQVQLLDKMLCPWWNDRLYGPDVQKTVVFHSCRSSQVVVIPVVVQMPIPMVFLLGRPWRLHSCSIFLGGRCSCCACRS